ncbi:MAG: hypothetical protein O3C13_02085 [Bacteroidetes bacterium]|nr:hypothetical protein [Bacteroidota bacterium]MDA0984235.1 hypothetical protein [Bacteroidota bacterium]
MKQLFRTFLFFLLLGCSQTDFSDFPFLPPVIGNWERVQTFGGSFEDIARGVRTTRDNGFVIIGNTESTDGDFSGKNRAGSDYFLMKFDANFQLEWTQTYGGSKDDRGHDVVQLSDGGYALIGYSMSADGDATLNQGQHDNWLIRTDSQGTLLWQKSFGFLGHDHAYNIIMTSDGGLFFNGYLDVTASKGEGQEGKVENKSSRHGVGEFWCHKLDKDGNLEWRRYYGGTNNDPSYDAIETKNGDFILVGATESQDVDVSDPKGGYDFWVLKINRSGELLWERSIGGSGYDTAKAVVETSTGDYLIAGQTYSQDFDILDPKGSSDILFAWVSPEGVLKKTVTIGDRGFETLNALVEREDGTLVAVGHQSSNALSLEEEYTLKNDVLLVYTLANGEVLSSHTLVGNGLDLGEALSNFSNGKILVVGSTESTSGDFPNSKGVKDLFIAVWN